MTAKSTFRDFYVEKRFRADITNLEKALKDSASGRTRLVVVHSLETTPAHWGRGVGITPLLEAFVKRAPKVAKCQLLDFMDIRSNRTDSHRKFFEKVLVEKVLDKQESRKEAFRHYCRSALARLEMFLQSSIRWTVALIVSIFIPIFIPIVVAVLRTNDLVIGPNLVQVWDQYHGWLWVVSSVVLVLVLVLALSLLSFRETIRDDTTGKRTQWDKSAPEALKNDVRETRRDQLLRSPEGLPKNILRSLSRRRLLFPKKRKQCLLLVVDDVDCIDGNSVNLILELFETARVLEREHRVCVVLGYNPAANPDDLRSSEESQVHASLFQAPTTIDIHGEESRVFVSLPRLELDVLTELLCEYFDSSDPVRLIDLIKEQHPEASTRHLFGFCNYSAP